MERLYRAARSFAFGYFVGLGILALTHYVTDRPATVQDAELLALVAGVGALVAHLARRRDGGPGPDRARRADPARRPPGRSGVGGGGRRGPRP